jgi:hypothetical protein
MLENREKKHAHAALKEHSQMSFTPVINARSKRLAEKL